MSYDIQLKDGYSVSIYNHPDKCPICHKHIKPLFRVAEYTTRESEIQVNYRCTVRDCQSYFIGTFSQIGSRGAYSLKSIAPRTANKKSFKESISTTSPVFVEIYNQILLAESLGLSQLVGIGLRKALEFLIKDFLIQENPKEEESIKNDTLGRCIHNRLEDGFIKECAKRATWLGNDETHYVRKWENRDIEDLKRLVDLTVNWVDSHITTKQFIDEMNRPSS